MVYVSIFWRIGRPTCRLDCMAPRGHNAGLQVFVEVDELPFVITFGRIYHFHFENDVFCSSPVVTIITREGTRTGNKDRDKPNWDTNAQIFILTKGATQIHTPAHLEHPPVYCYEWGVVISTNSLFPNFNPTDDRRLRGRETWRTFGLWLKRSFGWRQVECSHWRWSDETPEGLWIFSPLSEPDLCRTDPFSPFIIRNTTMHHLVPRGERG